MNKKGLFAKDDSFWNLLIGEKLLSMILIAAALCLSHWADLVKMEFLIGVLVLLESVMCFRIGRWVGTRKKAAEKKGVQPVPLKSGK